MIPCKENSFSLGACVYGITANFVNGKCNIANNWNVCTEKTKIHCEHTLE